MLIIWGRHTSSNVEKLLWACTEMGVSFERRDMAGKFGFTDEYLAMNPNRVVPTIDDDGFILWESNACLRYLAAKHGAGTLWPEDLQVRANADRWMDWCTTTLWVALRPVFHGLIRTSLENRDMEAITAAAKSTGEILAILDDWLADRDFVCGDAFTMGDIPVGFVLYRWYALDVEHPERPNVRAWYERLTERPGYREYIMIPLE
ncbi:MAG: glutathione S-transferase [Alphaproteobacteria bacterium]|nr:glutathione S-transferase [Alphaproteobacteria bacterium]MCZ6589140.1 glutathione S-transferase [Alphaproteobacteria bacterium]